MNAMSITAFILVITDVGEEKKVVERVKAEFSEYVKEAWITYGEYDAIIKVKVPNMMKLDEVVTGIRKVRGVRRTTTLIAA